MCSLRFWRTTARALGLLALASTGTVACRKEPARPTAPASSASAPTSASAPKPGTGASGPKPHLPSPVTSAVAAKLWAGKCPNWVHGARSRIEDTPDGMLVFITAAEARAVAEIRSRARYLAEGKSKGGDGTGRCPVPRGGVSEVVDVEQGAKLTVRAAAGASPAALQERARALLEQIPNE